MVGVNAPAVQEITGEKGLQLFDRVAPIDDRSDGYTTERVSSHFGIVVHWIARRSRNVRFLDQGGRIADDAPVPAHDSNPIDRQSLMARTVGKLLFSVLVDRL